MDWNLNYKQRKTIPVIFHNLKNYSRIILWPNWSINTIIASSMENYITLKLRKYRCAFQMVFLYSFKFSATSLENSLKTLYLSNPPYLKKISQQILLRNAYEEMGLALWLFFFICQAQLPLLFAFYSS